MRSARGSPMVVTQFTFDGADDELLCFGRVQPQRSVRARRVSGDAIAKVMSATWAVLVLLARCRGVCRGRAAAAPLPGVRAPSRRGTSRRRVLPGRLRAGRRSVA